MIYNKLFYSVAALGLALQICDSSPVAAMQEDASSSASPAKKPAPAKTSEQTVEQIPHGAFLAPRRVGAGTSIVTSNLYTPDGTPIVERHNGQIPEHQLLIFGGKLKHTNGIVKSAPSKSAEAPKTDLSDSKKRALKDRKESKATKSAKELQAALAAAKARRESAAQQQQHGVTATHSATHSGTAPVVQQPAVQNGTNGTTQQS